MIVAFFSDGAEAAMAALLAATGLASVGSVPHVVVDGRSPTSSPGTAIRFGVTILPSGRTVAEIIEAARRSGAADVLLALPNRLLSDPALMRFADVRVALRGPAVPAGPFRAPLGPAGVPKAPWHLDSGPRPALAVEGTARGARQSARLLPFVLPELNRGGTAFLRDGIPGTPPLREGLVLAAILQALALDPESVDAEVTLREQLLGSHREGDEAVDRLTDIADRLDALTERAAGGRARRPPPRPRPFGGRPIDPNGIAARAATRTAKVRRNRIAQRAR